ncbi:MAG: ribonuclease P protein component [Bdellovibrionota bacterium]
MPASNPKKKPQGFGYEFRLHYPREYRRFFDQSQVFRLSECVVFRVPNELKHFRLGITLKARGSSLERNHVKRQIRETFRQHREQLGNFDYNVVVPASKKMAHPYPTKLGACLRKALTGVLAQDL